MFSFCVFNNYFLSEIDSNDDIIFSIDLEKAIEYSIMNEIPSQSVLNTSKLQAFYRWLEAITKYVSIRNQIWQFLSAIKTWMFENIGGSSTIRGDELLTKLKELSAKYHPFDNPAKDWKGKIQN